MASTAGGVMLPKENEGDARNLAAAIVEGFTALARTMVAAVDPIVDRMFELRLLFQDSKTHLPDVNGTSQAYRTFYREQVLDPIRAQYAEDDSVNLDSLFTTIRTVAASRKADWMRSLIKTGALTKEQHATVTADKPKPKAAKVSALTQIGKDVRAAVSASRTKDGEGNTTLDRVGFLGVAQSTLATVADSLNGETVRLSAGERDRIKKMSAQVAAELVRIDAAITSLAKAAAPKRTRKARTVKAA